MSKDQPQRFETLAVHAGYSRDPVTRSAAVPLYQTVAYAFDNAQHGADRGEKALRAYRLYLAGCALAFERGWVALHQILATRPDDRMDAAGPMKGARSDYPFNRAYMYGDAAATAAP